ncbi:hypothetical protein [Pseudoalteromonas luteoviolacea]|uniref:Uncharacterized protein n=1 Tax=Pseudoalteromonas luteoviolacea DSM 6061 TaxID=1365250 RepID=A0A166VB15_9GAMM|nr:hypothetical protein [Pseudoalteromonas luteoviolacea]KZN32438.1 hypothetical protein N475_22415 [Pseudoalteromonas luteoviolacea DSM 6061]MBE0386049.1 hypothetical protein [Pseudoalteromonas luteoviolacea DSM 6061]
MRTLDRENNKRRLILEIPQYVSDENAANSIMDKARIKLNNINAQKKQIYVAYAFNQQGDKTKENRIGWNIKNGRYTTSQNRTMSIEKTVLSKNVEGNVAGHLWKLEWPSVTEQELEELRAENLKNPRNQTIPETEAIKTRKNFPFAKWRELAHEVGKEINTYGNTLDLRSDNALYITGDDDFPLDKLTNAIGKTESEFLNTGTTLQARVIGMPYIWQSPDETDIEKSDFISKINDAELEGREELFNKHPLRVYYPEPSTIFNRTAADIVPSNKVGTREQARKISTIWLREVSNYTKAGEDSAARDLMTENKNSQDVAKKVFSFKFSSPIKTALGARVSEIDEVYSDWQSDKQKRQLKDIKDYAKRIDQSVLDQGYGERILKWHKTLHSK